MEITVNESIFVGIILIALAIFVYIAGNRMLKNL